MIDEASVERFWMKVDLSGDCWMWTGAKGSHGYGDAWIAAEHHNHLAHRLAWRLTRGPIPSGMYVLHSCDVRLCVNPAHLFLGTAADNTQDMMVKGRHRTVAKRGARHPMAKLTDADVNELRRLRSEGWTLETLAARFGIVQSTAGRIASGRTWRLADEELG